nr:MAG TPA: hypothetical protein [Caudoviricetes sp.]
MFDVDFVMKIGSTVGDLADNSNGLLEFLDKLESDTDFKDETRKNIKEETNAIEKSLVNITMLLSSEMQGE